MASNYLQFNPVKIRSWLNRTPFFTRVVWVLIAVFWVTSLFLPSWFIEWAALIPSDVGLATMYQLNTYAFVHWGLMHAVIDTIALIPLLERFEAEHGTLVSIALFVGPFATFPGFLYILFDHIILRHNSAMLGASIWVSLLLACEAIKMYKTNPFFAIGPYKIPTWTAPLVLISVVHFLDPNSSILSHLCGAVIGYGFELGYLKFLVPPEKAMRFIEGKLDLLGRVPRYVSVDQKTFGRYGVLPTTRDIPRPLDVVESMEAGGFNVDSP